MNISVGKKSKYWYLSHFNLFKRLKERELMFLSENSKMKNFSQGDRIYESVSTNDNIYLLKKGLLRLSKIQENGNEIVISLIKEGSIFGFSKLLHEDNSQGDEVVMALQNSIICVVTKPIFQGLMDNNKDINNHVLKLAGLRIRRLENKLEDLIYKTAETRIREFITRFIKEYGVNVGPYYEVKHFLTNKDIGNLTNATRQKVNEVMNSMKREKIIDFDRKKLRLIR